MTADLQAQAYVTEAVLYMALELSHTKWRLAFGDGTRQRQVVIAAGDVASLGEQLAQVKGKWGRCPQTGVVSCYEAGRDGFWLHRQLVALGIANQVVDAASIEVSRRARRAKTDRHCGLGAASADRLVAVCRIRCGAAGGTLKGRRCLSDDWLRRFTGSAHRPCH